MGPFAGMPTPTRSSLNVHQDGPGIPYRNKTIFLVSLKPFVSIL